MSMNKEEADAARNAGAQRVEYTETIAAAPDARSVAWDDAEANNRRRFYGGRLCHICSGSGVKSTGAPDFDENRCDNCAGTGKLYAVDLQALQTAVNERATWIDPEQKLTGVVGELFFAVEYMGEAGEGGNIVKKIVRETLGIEGSRASVTDLGKELADDIITACNLARLYGIDLNYYVRGKFNETSRVRNLPTLI